MAGSVDIHKAVAALWASSGLDTVFKSYWSVAAQSLYLTLNDGEAAPKTPFPFVVYEATKQNTRTKTSADGSFKRHINDQPWTFMVYAKQTTLKTAKELASDLASELLKIFGGHPTVHPSALTLDNGKVLLVQYENDYGERAGDDTHKWTISYNILTDVPVAV